jgi:hypothetical protein
MSVTSVGHVLNVSVVCSTYLSSPTNRSACTLRKTRKSKNFMGNENFWICIQNYSFVTEDNNSVVHS